ncbi:MAG: pentapeptide repeat-containing protein [Blastocatellia bacterium]
MSAEPICKAQIFQGADLKEANLCGANLRDADLSRSNIATPTKLQGADLRKAQIEGADFTGAEYDERTRFPEAFSPQQQEMAFRRIE